MGEEGKENIRWVAIIAVVLVISVATSFVTTTITGNSIFDIFSSKGTTNAPVRGGSGNAIICNDTDGGWNVYLKGTATGQSSDGSIGYGVTDHCAGDKLLVEAYCSNNSGPVVANYTCDYHYICQDGACVYNTNGTNINGTTIDSNPAGTNAPVTGGTDGTGPDRPTGTLGYDYCLNYCYSAIHCQIPPQSIEYCTELIDTCFTNCEGSWQAPGTSGSDRTPSASTRDCTTYCAEKGQTYYTSCLAAGSDQEPCSIGQQIYTSGCLACCTDTTSTTTTNAAVGTTGTGSEGTNAAVGGGTGETNRATSPLVKFDANGNLVYTIEDQGSRVVTGDAYHINYDGNSWTISPIVTINGITVQGFCGCLIDTTKYGSCSGSCTITDGVCTGTCTGTQCAGASCQNMAVIVRTGQSIGGGSGGSGNIIEKYSSDGKLIFKITDSRNAVLGDGYALRKTGVNTAEVYSKETNRAVTGSAMMCTCSSKYIPPNGGTCSASCTLTDPGKCTGTCTGNACTSSSCELVDIEIPGTS